MRIPAERHLYTMRSYQARLHFLENKLRLRWGIQRVRNYIVHHEVSWWRSDPPQGLQLQVCGPVLLPDLLERNGGGEHKCPTAHKRDGREKCDSYNHRHDM